MSEYRSFAARSLRVSEFTNNNFPTSLPSDNNFGELQCGGISPQDGHIIDRFYPAPESQNQSPKMSVFSKLLMSRKAAKDVKAKQAEKEKTADATAKIPYKHTPTHAAVDALSGAPSSWKSEDRGKIMEHHKRRSQMAISRTASSLSTMSYMNSAAGPSSSAPPLPRITSYSSYNPTWYDRTGDLGYSNDAVSKRHKPNRGHSYNDSGIGPSPLASNVQSEEVSPVVSSGNSTTSNNSSDNLEMANNNSMSQRPQPMVYAEKDIFDRLHTSTTRKLGEAPISASPAPSHKAPTPQVAQEIKPKKQRWSLLGKRQSIAV